MENRLDGSEESVNNLDLVCRGNVIYELYAACLGGEIGQKEFLRVKSIVNRARRIPDEEIPKIIELRYKR